MNKHEIYYKFIFTNYDSLSYNSNNLNFVPLDDGVDQNGEVRALCNACPKRVITYDQLSAADSLLPMYSDNWTSEDRTRIKSYVDQWKALPKYFDLRDYNDQDPSQILGMSLMVSHSPEIGNTSTPWTKFTSSYDNKVIYCSLMVSSGDFFYSFNLPEEVLIKSKLRDEIVTHRFHKNWYFTKSEKAAFSSIMNVEIGQEKRVFVQHYFDNSFPYGVHNETLYYVNYKDANGNIYLRTDSRLHCCDINGSFNAEPEEGQEHGDRYTGSYRNFPPAELIDYYFVTLNGEDVRVTMYKYSTKEVTYNENNPGRFFLINDPSIEVSPVHTVEKYNHFNEDLKKDFIDLEVTRRILYYYDGVHLKYNNTLRDIHQTSDIPHIVSGLGYDTELSYEPTNEYLDKDYTYKGITVRGTPPLQIPYNLLRYSLNDRPPFTDCETVLVMWVANSDPKNIADGDVASLHNLNWQQYAIPVSVRCCYKDNTANKHCHERFLVQYPYRQRPDTDNPTNHSVYNYHFKCNEEYNKDRFDSKRALFLKDLIEYSKDYVIACQHKEYIGTDMFDNQKYLFTKCGACKALYVKKQYLDISSSLKPLSYRRNISQVYYLYVPNTLYTVDLNSTDYLRDASNTAMPFNPSVAPANKPDSEKYFRKKNFENWDFLYDNAWGTDDNTCAVYDIWRIALFDASNKQISSVSGSFQLANKIVNKENLLKKFLCAKASVFTWNDVYISSLGVTPYNPFENDAYVYNISVSYDITYVYPIGLLDGYIQIGNTVYGRTANATNNKVVVGFKLMYDYKYEDLYHFKYDTVSKQYKPVTVKYDFVTKRFVTSQATFWCTAYIMRYN